ncbi:hypothetical protein SAMN04487944_11933 [Gracilibacillus ureilyticus]|uniref:Uncharacterized protein n=1 Tax=Gracilibacillus ureilyticus TaxID=531814 RepID=A0A1H9USY7_9BACI|nr:hypothetical protein [Gracilibacillus ureilyticus]SES12526.1 hypothetical protein SAMN04487944_11933 [Gracilibacillus ureilyticus]
MLDQVIFDTQFPWDQVDEIWPHAKIEIGYIILNARERLRELMDNAHGLIEELLRVDHLIYRLYFRL